LSRPYRANRVRIENLSSGDLVSAAELALANAEELRAEAVLLAEHGRSARAYALAHVALEELSKIPMAVRLARDLDAGLAVDWASFGRRFRDHGAKISTHATADYMFSEIRPDDSDVAAYLEDLERVPERLARRDASLYVDFDGSGFVKPDDAITARDVTELLAYLDPRLDFYRRTLPEIAAALRQGTSAEAQARWRAFREALDSVSRGNAGAT
jgi:AbiV family abortive infection protein